MVDKLQTKGIKHVSSEQNFLVESSPMKVETSTSLDTTGLDMTRISSSQMS
jgi:hypothetical protein